MYHRLLMEIMYKNPMSIMNLRIDSLAQAGCTQYVNPLWKYSILDL